MITRRQTFVWLAASAIGTPTQLLAQRVYRIAVLIQGPERLWDARFKALRAGLRELGYAEGKNLTLNRQTSRWSNQPNSNWSST